LKNNNIPLWAKPMSDICLIFPRDPKGYALASTLADGESLGLGYIASSLRFAGYTVKIINAETFKIEDNELINKILETKPKIVGFSPVAVNMASTLHLCNEIKVKNKDIHITLGGHHVTFAAKDILTNEPSVDSIIVGNGDRTVVELAQAIIKKSNDLNNINGIVFRNNDEVIVKEKGQTENIDKLPFPARDTLEEIISKTGKREARLLTSWGCFNNCVFCTTPCFYPLGWQGRSAERVVEEICDLVKKYGINHLWITDDNFIISTDESHTRARKIAQLIIDKKLNITFRILCRADSLRNDEQLVDILKKAGMTIAYIGLESGDPRTMLRLGKRVTIQQNKEMVELLSKHKISIQIGFIMFTPYATIQALQNNVKFLAQIGELYRFFPLTRAIDVFPGSPLLSQLKKDGLLSSKYNYKSEHIDYSFVHPEIQDILNLTTLCYDDESIEFDSKLLGLKLIELSSIFKKQREDIRLASYVNTRFVEINSINRAFFMKLLKTKGKLSESILNSLNHERKNRIKKLYDELNLAKISIEVG